MSEPQLTEATPTSLEHEALFGQLVMQQANMALMFLGKVAHPESGQSLKDTDAAKLFIDELEMLEVKTRGNLSKAEEGLLKQTLMGLRLAFVEAVESAEAPSERTPAPAQTSPSVPVAGAAQSPLTTGLASAPAEEHPKKFSKKY
jgi:hypothetical protein